MGNEPIVVPGAAQRLLDGCRSPLLMPFWPIVWSASFAHAPPSSSLDRLLFFILCALNSPSSALPFLF